MSKLDKQDDDWLYLTGYVHHEPESWSSWELDPVTHKPLYSQEVQDAEHYALYEIKVQYRIHKKSGKTQILSFNG